MHAPDERRYSDYVAAHLPRLHRLAYLLCRDPDRADDIVQNAIIKLYRHWRRASAAESLDSYVRAIVVRTFLDEQRLRWATVRLLGRPQDMPEAAAPVPDTETGIVVHAALTRLPPRQRVALVLRFLYDLSTDDTAAAMSCSTGNVKRLTADGLTRLRGLLDGEPGWPTERSARVSRPRRP